jgi:hypothetical protein
VDNDSRAEGLMKRGRQTIMLNGIKDLTGLDIEQTVHMAE